MRYLKFIKTQARRLLNVLMICAILSISVWAQQEQKAPPAPPPNLETLDVPALIQASDRNGAAMHLHLLEFTYIQKRITREIDPKGKVIERIREFEAYPIKTEARHRHVLSLIKKDGVPVSPEHLKLNRQFAVAEMEQAEPEDATTSPKPESEAGGKYVTAGIGIGFAGEGVWLGVSQFLRQCRFDASRLEQLENRQTIVLNMHSCQDIHADLREAYLAKLTGIVWIDATDKVVIRLKAWPMSALSAEQSTGEVIVYEQQRVQGGIWVPRRIRLNGIGKAAIFNGVDKDMIFEFTDYRHFSTEIKETEVLDPKKKPIPF